MNNTTPRSTARCLLVWALATAVAALGCSLLAPGTSGLVHDLRTAFGAAPGAATVVRFDRLLSGAATVVLLGCLIWAWAVTSVVVAEALWSARRSRSGETGVGGVSGLPGVPGWARRLVLVACGAALVVSASSAGATAATPTTAAAAATGTHAVVDAVARAAAEAVADLDLDGLPYPDRPTAPERPPRPTAPAEPPPGPPLVHEVRAGESLWSVAEDALTDHGRDPDTARVAALVARIHADNRAVVGDDPDLVQPGQRLRLPHHLS